MPGRKGRSRGCFSCRKRKIKCDETLPVCRLCNLSGFSCEYPDITFVEVRSAVSMLKTKPALVTTGSQQVSPSLLSVRGGLVQRMTEGYFLGELWHSFNRTESPTSVHTWPGFLADHDKYPLGRKCLLMLAQMYTARTREADCLAKHATQLYLESMESLRYALGRPRCQATNDVILAIMILTLYEMLVDSSNDGWIKHAFGLACVIELRTPQSFSDPISLQILEWNRFAICLASLATSKPTFLSQRKWKNRPWQSRAVPKDCMQSLLDSFADLATLNSVIVSEVETVRAHSGTEVLRVMRDLSLWRTFWDSWDHGRVDEMIQEESVNIPIIPVAFRFPSLFEVSCVSIYNAALIQAIVLLERCTRELVEVPQINTFGVNNHGDHSALANNAAIEICMTAQGCLPQAIGDTTLQFLLLYPLRMAWIALGKSMTSQGLWIENLLTQFSLTKSSWAVISQVLSSQLPKPANSRHVRTMTTG